MYFAYGEKETEYLKEKDKKLAAVIDQIGHLNRTVDTDLYASVIHHIIGQQITAKAQRTIWNRMQDVYGEITPETIGTANISRLQSFGMTFRKATYIKAFSQKILIGEWNPKSIEKMSDEDAIAALTKLPGVGRWTAEMILLFCLQRPDILSYGDLAIHRGMRMVYRHKEIDKKRFAIYQKRLSPYGSIASLYFWAVAGGAIAELTDPAAGTGGNKG